MKHSALFTSLFIETRGRVYLLWLVLTTTGFIATHFHQYRTINPVWLVISIIGLVYMYKVMPMRVGQMKRIFYAWLIPITVGMIISGLVFVVSDLQRGIGYLGTIWLALMAIGYVWNGLVDRPMFWYVFAAAINVAAAWATFFYEPYIINQYLVAAVISFWSMANLWILRT